jgi:hypothetical protein
MFTATCGIDQNGDPITSRVVVENDASRHVGNRLARSEGRRPTKCRFAKLCRRRGCTNAHARGCDAGLPATTSDRRRLPLDQQHRTRTSVT